MICMGERVRSLVADLCAVLTGAPSLWHGTPRRSRLREHFGKFDPICLARPLRYPRLDIERSTVVDIHLLEKKDWSGNQHELWARHRRLYRHIRAGQPSQETVCWRPGPVQGNISRVRHLRPRSARRQSLSHPLISFPIGSEISRLSSKMSTSLCPKASLATSRR